MGAPRGGRGAMARAPLTGGGVQRGLAALCEEGVGLLGRRIELRLHLALAEGLLALPRSRVEDVAEAALVGVLDLPPLRDRRVGAAFLDGREERLVVGVGVADLLLRRQARREEAQEVGVVLLNRVAR